MKGETDLAYETKVILTAIANAICKADNLKEAYVNVQEMANVEGLVLKSFEDKKAELAELKNEQKQQ